MVRPNGLPFLLKYQKDWIIKGPLVREVQLVADCEPYADSVMSGVCLFLLLFAIREKTVQRILESAVQMSALLLGLDQTNSHAGLRFPHDSIRAVKLVDDAVGKETTGEVRLFHVKTKSLLEIQRQLMILPGLVLVLVFGTPEDDSEHHLALVELDAQIIGLTLRHLAKELAIVELLDGRLEEIDFGSPLFGRPVSHVAEGLLKDGLLESRLLLGAPFDETTEHLLSQRVGSVDIVEEILLGLQDNLVLILCHVD